MHWSVDPGGKALPPQSVEDKGAAYTGKRYVSEQGSVDV
jgi:hypothetical protein